MLKVHDVHAWVNGGIIYHVKSCFLNPMRRVMTRHTLGIYQVWEDRSRRRLCLDSRHCRQCNLVGWRWDND